MDIAALQKLEALGEHRVLEQKLAGARSPQVLRYATAYYVRRGQPAKVLTCYAEYIGATTAGERDLAAVAMAIDCARRLGRHSLVAEYFAALSQRERENLQTGVLAAVASSFASLGQFAEADRMVAFLRARSGLPQLRDFDHYVREKYGDARAIRCFINSTPAQFDPQSPAKSVQQALAIAFAHMAEGNYPKAVAVLEQCKATVG